MSVAELKNLQRLPLDRCYEFVALEAGPKALARDLPVSPGSIQCNEDGDVECLQFAPRRWLVPRPAMSMQQRLAEWETAGHGHLFDVAGKWQWFRIEGEGGARLLESTVNVHALLDQRACAATFLFDCPSILARVGATCDLWIVSSYVESFLDAIGSLRFLAA